MDTEATSHPAITISTPHWQGPTRPKQLSVALPSLFVGWLGRRSLVAINRTSVPPISFYWPGQVWHNYPVIIGTHWHYSIHSNSLVLHACLLQATMYVCALSRSPVLIVNHSHRGMISCAMMYIIAQRCTSLRNWAGCEWIIMSDTLY